MKKIIISLLTLLLIASMAMPAFAVTPSLESPDLPEIPDISGSVEVEVPDSTFDDYFEEKPIEPEQPVEEAPVCSWKGVIERWIKCFARWVEERKG